MPLPFRRHHRISLWRLPKILSLLPLALFMLLPSPGFAADTGPSANSHWQLVLLKGVAQIDPSITTLDIDKDNKISGNTGCNRFVAQVIGNSDRLFGKLATTGKDCPPPSDKQQQGFLDAMKQAVSWSVDKETDQLALRDADGKLLAAFIPRQDPEYYFDCGGQIAHVILHSREEISLTYQDKTHVMTRVQGGDMKRFAGDGLQFQAKGRNGQLDTADGRTLDCHLVPKPTK